jgi:hypothetical protein
LVGDRVQIRIQAFLFESPKRLETLIKISALLALSFCLPVKAQEISGLQFDPVFNLFGKNLLPEQRGDDVVHSGVIYEAGQSFDTVADCTKTEGAEYQKQNHFDLRV